MEVGDPRQAGEVTCGGSPHLSCKRGQIKMRDYMDKRVTQPERVTSPTWGPPPPCTQALINGRKTTTKKYRTDLAREFKLIRNEEIYILVE